MRYQYFDKEGNSVSIKKIQSDEVAVVFDTQTELYWEVKSFDQNDNRYYDKMMTWEEFNKNYIDDLNKMNYGGYNDWRAPSKHELRSLISYRGINPAYVTDMSFTLTVADYWAGGSYALRNEDCGWVINFNIGATTAKNKSLTACGIAVRGKGLPSAKDRFVDNGDGTITDNYLKLMWQKDQDERKSYNQVMEMLPNYELAGYRDWRLPTMHELSSIFDESYEDNSWYYEGFFKHDKVKPPILQHITSNLFADTFVWVTNFNFGYDGYYGEKSIPLCYRLVRNLDTSERIFVMPSSGQKEIYSATGDVLNFDPERASVSFGELEDYIIDLKTGIHYEKSGAKSYTLDEAKEHINQLNASFYGGTNNWRLPTVDELRMIADFSKKNPAVFDKFAPYVKNDFYWTGEEYSTPNGERNWTIYFGYGCAVPIERVHRCGCIAITGGYENLADKSMKRYEIKDGVVIDKYTKLMWLQAELPEMTYSEFEKYLAENELAGYNDWRIPDMKELSTLVNREAKNNEWFNTELFPNIYDRGRNHLMASETFNGMFNWGTNMNFAYDGYYANRLVGVYRLKPVRRI